MIDHGLPDIIDRIYDLVLDPGSWPEVLSRVAHAVGGVGGVVIPISNRGAPRLIVSPEMEEATAAYQRHWWRHDRRVKGGAQRGLDRGIVTDRDFQTDAEIDRDPFYQDFLRPHGLKHFLGHVSVPVPRRALGLSILRDRRLGPFEQADVERLGVLGRHLMRSIRMAADLSDVLAVRSALTAVVERTDTGVLVLDDAGRVVFRNRAAERALGTGLTLHNRRLCSDRPSIQQTLDRLVASVLPGSGVRPAPAVAVPRSGGKTPLLVQALPLKPGTADPFGTLGIRSGGALLILTVLLVGHTGSVESQLVRLGLTGGQARVATLIGEGHAVKHAAEVLGIKEASVRQVLKAIYANLGIARQSQLAVIVTRLKAVRVDPDLA